MAVIQRGLSDLPRSGSNIAAPIVRLSYDVEAWSGLGVSNFYYLNLHTEEVEPVVGVRIEPVDGCPVLLKKLSCDPDYARIPF